MSRPRVLRRWGPGFLLGVGLCSLAVHEPLVTGAGHDGALVELTNGEVVLGVVPGLGGRAVLLKTTGGANLFSSDETRWRPPFPPPALDTAFEPWNGRIVWVGPQSAFWSQQELRPDRRAQKAGWPPDPFAETGRFAVREKTGTRLRLQGPTSPVTGLSLEHEYEIIGARTVRMKVTATNRRDTPVSWDLWPNTRVRPEGWPYVALAPSEAPRLAGPRPDEPALGPYPTETREGWITLPPGARPTSPKTKLWAKAFVRPARGLIAFFHGRELLLVRAPVVAKERLHPEQAFVEIYRGASDEEDILELEMHGPYETLPPGASMSFQQTFEIVPLDQEAKTGEARLERLRAID